jgi:hypothetical protein
MTFDTWYLHLAPRNAPPLDLARAAFEQGQIEKAREVLDQIRDSNRLLLEALPARMRENVLTNQNQ